MLPRVDGALEQLGREKWSNIDATAAKFALSQYAADYKFFNHGAFFTYGGMSYPDQDPVSDWFVAAGNPTVICQPFDKPIFTGLPAEYAPNCPWGNVICGVTHQAWESLFPFLGGVALIDQQKKLLYCAFSAEVTVVDPVLAERRGLLSDLPTINVTLFGVETSHDCWAPVKPLNVRGLPGVVRHPPRPAMTQLTASVMAGDVGLLAKRESAAMQPFLDEYRQILRDGPKLDY